MTITLGDLINQLQQIDCPEAEVRAAIIFDDDDPVIAIDKMTISFGIDNETEPPKKVCVFSIKYTKGYAINLHGGNQ